MVATSATRAARRCDRGLHYNRFSIPAHLFLPRPLPLFSADAGCYSQPHPCRLSQSPYFVALMMAFALTQFAHADELAEVQRLYVSGQASAALERVERALATRPNDAQLQFQRGLMLAEGKRIAEAEAVFQKLTEDHPDLAEPYNNLAALQAATGDYAKARITLEQALRANPVYATAHENLGDVYAALAAQSYRRALVLEPGNPSVPRKIDLMREMQRSQPAPAAIRRGALPLASAGAAIK